MAAHWFPAISGATDAVPTSSIRAVRETLIAGPKADTRGRSE